MNAARIQFKKTQFNTVEQAEPQNMTVLEGDFIETRHITALDATLKEKNEPYCHFRVNKISSEHVSLELLNLEEAHIELEINKPKVVENIKSQESYTLTLLGIRTESGSIGTEF